MVTERITNPETIGADDIEAILSNGRSATVQFSEASYSTGLLESLNDLCSTYRSCIEVRFFGHYTGGFDASVLAHLQDVSWLAVDSLKHISNEEELWRLPLLERFSFGVFEFDRPEFLDGLPLEQLRYLSISENRKRNFNIAPLGRCENLRELFVQGHTKHIAILAEVPQLEVLHLSGIPKRQDLSFINKMTELKSLDLLLGGRPSIDEIHHPLLQELRITRVRGLETLGPLARFPSLRRLKIQDQLQLREISASGLQLHDLRLLNCKNLSRILGLSEQDELVHFRVSRTQIDLDNLLDFHWPPSMEILALHSNNEKWNKTARRELDRRGYREFS